MNYITDLKNKREIIKNNIQTESRIEPIKQLISSINQLEQKIKIDQNVFTVIKKLNLDINYSDIKKLNHKIDEYNKYTSTIKNKKEIISSQEVENWETTITNLLDNIEKNVENSLRNSISEHSKKIENLRDLADLLDDGTKETIRKSKIFFSFFPTSISNFYQKYNDDIDKNKMVLEYEKYIDSIKEISEELTYEKISEEFEIKETTIPFLLKLISGNKLSLNELSKEVISDIKNSNKLKNKLYISYGE